MCLIDAEDYSDLPIRQYEEDNVLRELNKAYLGFRQHYPDAAAAAGSEQHQEQQQPQEQLQQRLPPVGASRDSSPSSRQASTIIGTQLVYFGIGHRDFLSFLFIFFFLKFNFFFLFSLLPVQITRLVKIGRI